ncbi:MAG: TolC family protein [Candidatus Solibacter usitatus]|nr:TolC family protein [Candidatus Solibacter usitatus]
MRLTLPDAEAAALRNHPRISSARLQAQAAREQITQTRAALRPSATMFLTATGADPGSTISAGTVQTSSLSSRTATGFSATQTLFDFGRNSVLTNSVRLRADAQEAGIAAVRADVLLRVREAYYRSLAAQAQSGLAEQTLAARKVTLKQIAALTASSLRSTLDQSFAELNVSEAEIDLEQARNRHGAALVDLAAAMGADIPARVQLEEQPAPDGLPDSADGLTKMASEKRPEIQTARLLLQSARRFADSERRLMLPTIGVTAAAGLLGPRDARLLPHYGGIGLNVSIPLFNGSLFTSRRREADLRADAVEQDVRDLEIRVAREVRTAWLDADTARRKLDLTARHLEQARKTFRLARTRYEAGLGTIVEFTQAQLSETAAEVGAVTARYEYLYRRALLDYASGQ